MANNILDLEEIVLNWVNNFPLNIDQRQNLDDVRPTDIDWKHLRIKHGSTEYYDQVQESQPRTHVVFTSHFTNETSQPQTFTMSTERTTTSICSISMEKAYTIGYSVDIKLAPPNPVVEANAGFKGELSVTNSNEQTVEEQLVWSVDNQINVPPRSRIRADLVLKEEEYSSFFQCRTSFDGRVLVKLRNKRNRSLVKTQIGHVREIFLREDGFQVDNSGIYFVSQGKCRCRFGKEQHVQLTQTAIGGQNNEYQMYDE